MTDTILVIDDQANVRTLLKDYLSSQGYRVVTANDGQMGLFVARHEHPNLILLDLMMPNMDGYQFISQLRRESETPVIMITAKQQEAEIIKGFDLGADDYITKPFRLRELLVRMRAVLRRAAPSDGVQPGLKVGDISLDRNHHEVKKNDQLIDLTPLEFHILDLLLRSAGKVVKRADLAIGLMENGYAGSEATLKIHIRNLRLKLGDDPDQPRYIETVFGIGYRFISEAE